jgi:predicted transcriptional regulator
MAEELVDIRAKVDGDTNRVLDAISMVTGLDKSAIVREALAAWATEERHKAEKIVQIMSSSKGNRAA